MAKLVSVFFATCLLITSVLSLDIVPDFLKNDLFSIYTHAAIETRELEHNPVRSEDVTFYMYSKENSRDYITLYEDNLRALADKKRKVVFFIHGWINNKDIGWYGRLKDAFLETYADKYTVVQVDWAVPAKQFYYVSSVNTYDVAKIIANLIIELKEDHGIPFEDILLIGHSLGGQITGIVGKLVKEKTGTKLPRVIALDPAGPLFDIRPQDKRLNKNDAEVVEVIHSNGGTFGFLSACGTIDFFLNGGSSQPGCKTIDLLDLKTLIDPISCDHMRAPEYLVEAVLNPTELVATKCETWKKFLLNKCEDETVPLGDLTTTKTGNFYLETNKEKPYSKSGRGRSKTEKILSAITGHL